MEESPETLIAGRSPDTEESEKSTEIPEPTETAKAQDMEESPGTLTPGGPPDTEDSEESTEIPEPTETAKTQDTEESPGTLTPGESPDTEDLSDYEIIPDNPEVPATENTQGMTGTQISIISPGTENKPDTMIPTGTQSLEANTDGESVPLNSQTGALVPVQHNSSLDFLWRILSFLHWFGFQATQTHEEDPASFGGKVNKIRTILHSTYTYIWWYFSGYHTVGIFSRSSESDYKWLIEKLKSEPFHSTVSTVLPHYISNNGMSKFRDVVSGCTFGILYHTKNRGRINIVDVTDSLYDEELKYLSEQLGKENVIVVVDDVEDASDEEKRGILESQPSIGNLATDILLFSATEKPVTISEVTQES